MRTFPGTFPLCPSYVSHELTHVEKLRVSHDLIRITPHHQKNVTNLPLSLRKTLMKNFFLCQPFKVHLILCVLSSFGNFILACIHTDGTPHLSLSRYWYQLELLELSHWQCNSNENISSLMCYCGVTYAQE